MDHFERPKSTVLPESALIPEQNLLRPPPDHFTHEVKLEQPYYYVGPNQSAPPEGVFVTGTKVVLLKHDGGPSCHVVDGRGLYVVTAFKGLRKMGDED